MRNLAVVVGLVVLAGCASSHHVQRSTASAGSVTFVPGYSSKGNGYKQVVERILSSSSVQKSVDVIQFNFNVASGKDPFVASLGKQLQALAASGKKVRVFIEDSGFGVGAVNHASGKSLGSDIEVYYLHGLANSVDSTSPGILHSKVVIVDGHLILAGSTNWSDRSISANPTAQRPANNETDLLIDSAPLGAAMTEYANKLETQAGKVPTSLLSRGSLSAESYVDGGTSLFIDAEYLPVLLKFISGTQNGESLDCSMYTLGAGDSSDPSHQGDQILNALEQATSKGVHLRMIFDNDSFNRYGTPLNHTAAQKLLSSAKGIYMTASNVITHQKFCVRTAKDGSHSALIGSSNWDYVDLSLNHQVNWLVTEDEPAAELLTYFNDLVGGLSAYKGN